jgi:hypothetical protein
VSKKDLRKEQRAAAQQEKVSSSLIKKVNN